LSERVVPGGEGLGVRFGRLHPPLHEFLPKLHDVEAQLERARIEVTDEVPALQRTYERVRALQEVNPMLATRGVRLGILSRAIYEMQIEAICRAVAAARGAGRDVHAE